MSQYHPNHTTVRDNSQPQPIRVIDLFAGVGGFRLGLAGSLSRPSKNYEVVWSNQWEPSTQTQHAAGIYEARFGLQPPYFNVDIAKVPTEVIPDHDLLVGGFPCQDYSVARTLSHAAGIIGKKGVLWWQIHRILEEKGKSRPRFLMLENVDRLLKSPAKQRGRDFAMMLSSLNNLGYVVEWRVINAAEYGMPQRRRRTYILGYLKDSEIGRDITWSKALEWLAKDGIFAHAFPCIFSDKSINKEFSLSNNLIDLSDTFNQDTPTVSPFNNTGLMMDGKVLTCKVVPNYNGPITTLGNILQPDSEVAEEFLVKPEDFERWQYLKGPKREQRKSSSGHEYFYSEGGMTFPDALDKPSRTIITGEGGSTPSRFKHVVQTKDGRYRRLTPVELERLNMFPDNHTIGIPNAKRAFMMGNALVVGVIDRLGEELAQRVQHPTKELTLSH